MLEEFVDSVLLIDDKKKEIQDLKTILEEKDIWVKYLAPNDCSKRIKTRRLIFMDLHIDETAGSNLAAHISKIRKILKNIVTKENASYGLIIWTNHIEEVNEFKSKIQSDTEYLKPLFIIGISKIEHSKNNYANLFDDINDKLSDSIAANFFINWSNLIQQGRDKAITSIFELIPDYQKQDKNLEFLLFKMAQNNIGIPDTRWSDFPLYKEAYKSFTELLSYEISKNIRDENLFSNQPEVDYFFDVNGSKNINGKYKIENSNYNLVKLEKDFNKLKNKIKIFKENGIDIDELEKSKKEKNDILKKINSYEKELNLLFAQINTRHLLDENTVDNGVIFPGRIYEIKDRDILLISNMMNDKDIPIAIEMTPPCDFANNKNDNPKLLGGFITKYSDGRIRQLKSDSFYTEAYPLKISEYPDLKLLVFDFKKIMIVGKNDFKDNKKYQLLFQAKDKLFADILQKMSSYTARLGLSIIR